MAYVKERKHLKVVFIQLYLIYVDTRALCRSASTHHAESGLQASRLARPNCWWFVGRGINRTQVWFKFVCMQSALDIMIMLPVKLPSPYVRDLIVLMYIRVWAEAEAVCRLSSKKLSTGKRDEQGRLVSSTECR